MPTGVSVVLFFEKSLKNCDKRAGCHVFYIKAVFNAGARGDLVDRDVFCRRAQQYQDMVFRIALNYYGSIQDAEDTVQDVLMKLYLAEDAFESEEHVRAWLIRVTINLCKNTLRSPWRKRRVPLEELCQAVSFDDREESALFSVVMALPEKYRTVLYLFYYEDCSVRRIAELLELRESAVTTRLFRARNLLKQKLQEAEAYE